MEIIVTINNEEVHREHVATLCMKQRSEAVYKQYEIDKIRARGIPAEVAIENVPSAMNGLLKQDLRFGTMFNG